MRRILTGLVAFLALTATFVVLPVYAAPLPAAEPVTTATDEVAMGSVTAPAPAADVQSGTTDPVAGVPATAPTLTVSRTGVEPFSLVGVTWAYDPAVTDTVVQVRVSDADGAWGSWTEVTPETADQAAARTGAQLRGGTSPLWTGPSTGVDVELVTRSGAQPTDVQLDLVDPGSSPADTSLSTPDIRDTAHAAATMPPVYSRAQWGADERIRTWAPQYAATEKAATLHHTADANGYSADEVPAIMRSIYRYHTVSLGWGDIGYNVVVDRFGRLWEGRYGGLASTVMGAHAGGFNTSTFGVSMLGNFDLVPVPQATVDAVAQFIAWKFSLFGIDPRGTTVLTSSGGGTSKYTAGTKVTLPTIFGHRDVGSTACPGRYGYARLGEIRDQVTALMGSSVPLVQRRYDSDSAVRALLGAAVSAPRPTPDGAGAYAHYVNGSLYASATTGAHVLRGAVRDKWAALGWERGPLGYPTTDVAATPDGTGLYAHFQYGSIYWTPATGAHTVAGAIRDKWAAAGWENGALGYPVGDLTTTPNGQAQYVHFQRGSVYWSQASGAHQLSGPVYDGWAASGWETSVLGLPTTDAAATPDGVGRYAHFQKGSLYWSPSTGAHLLRGGVLDAWSAAGWENGRLGYPLTDVTTTPNGQAEYAHFQRGSVYWSPATGGHLLSGAVYDSWARTGWETSTLGMPVSDVGTTPDGLAQFAHFQHGSIYATAVTGARVVPATVYAVWAASGWERGPLGYPLGDAAKVTPADSGGVGADAAGSTVQRFQGGAVYVSSHGAHAVSATFETVRAAAAATFVLGLPLTDQATTPDGLARYQHFQGGSIYATAGTGARAVPTAIRDAWAASGFERGPLGYPVTDTVPTPDGRGRFVQFQHGSVYWSAATGARVMRGPVLDAWASTGWEWGVLGYPITDVTTPPDGTGAYAYFQGGAVYWSPTSGAHAIRGATLATWARNGWEQGRLGYPTSEAQAVTGGFRTEFQHGFIFEPVASGEPLVTLR